RTGGSRWSSTHRTRVARRIHSRYGAPRWNFGCRTSRQWRGRRRRLKESSRSSTNPSRCARCRTTITRETAMSLEPSPHLSREIMREESESDAIGEVLRMDSPVAAMPGIGPKRAAALEARGIATAGDLIFHLPARYQDWRERTPGEDLRVGNIVVVEGYLGKISERPMRGSRWHRLASGWLNVGGRQIRVVWFNLPAYMRGYLPGGQRVLVRGRVAEGLDGGIEIVQPELHPLSDG